VVGIVPDGPILIGGPVDLLHDGVVRSDASWWPYVRAAGAAPNPAHLEAEFVAHRAWGRTYT
jgi:hypothetical protein